MLIKTRYFEILIWRCSS